MKKMLALTLALVMALGLCACGGDTTDNGDAPAENPETNSPAETVTLDLPPVEDLTGTDTSAIAGVEDGVLTVADGVYLRSLQLDPDGRFQWRCAHQGLQ